MCFQSQGYVQMCRDCALTTGRLIGVDGKEDFSQDAWTRLSMSGPAVKDGWTAIWGVRTRAPASFPIVLTLFGPWSLNEEQVSGQGTLLLPVRWV